MRGLLGGEGDAFLAALAAPPLSGIRVNTLKIPPEALRARVPWPIEAVPWCQAGFVVPPSARVGRHPYHAAGLYYAQEPSAMAAAEALAPSPGDWVIDLAAAPGGKATHLAALLGDRGLLVANDVDGARLPALVGNLERWGTRRTVVTRESPARLAGRWGAIFDGVLVDAPCSGEGMFRKSPAAIAAWSAGHVRGCAARQQQLLATAAALVRPGGRLVYSTCTFAPEENEAVVARFLDGHADFALRPIPLAGLSPGRADWLPEMAADSERTPGDEGMSEPDMESNRSAGNLERASDLGRLADLSLAARLWPHRQPGEGHFLALFERIEEANAESTQSGRRGARRPSSRRHPTPHVASSTLREASQAARSTWRAFADAAMDGDPAAESPLAVSGDRLYALPPDHPPLDGVRVVRPGLWLGTLRGDRLVPSHSLALALHAGDARRRVDMAVEDDELERYVSGHPLTAAGDPGWVLITVDGHPLGWGRRAQGVVKNALPKGLRTFTANRSCPQRGASANM